MCSMYLASLVVLLVASGRVIGNCDFPGAPAHSTVTFSSGTIGPGVLASYSCDPGLQLLGPAQKRCQENGTWTPEGIPFCVLNVAAGKAPMQSSTAQGGIPQKAVDGSTSGFYNPNTCTLTERESAPVWYVNLLEPFVVQLVRIDFGRSCCQNNAPVTIVVRVGNNRPDLSDNPVCSRFIGFMEEGRPLFLPCSPPIPGAFVSVHLESATAEPLSICEAFVYTDQALPVEQCPVFSDSSGSSTVTYNGKCYTFHSERPLSFVNAQELCLERGGSLIDNSSPALQGFLSWELWRRHRNSPEGQYWMGAVRDPLTLSEWRWIDGRDVKLSFWSPPTTDGNCARFDGNKDWLWSQTDCSLPLNFICQYIPVSCGRPEQPPASALLASANFAVGSQVQYRCQSGHVMDGPGQRQCLSNGFYTGYPPACTAVECGQPASISNGTYRLTNGDRSLGSVLQYSCDPGQVMIGRGRLVCGSDQRWDGPPPSCQPRVCSEPQPILNGGLRLLNESSVVGAMVEYFCTDSKFTLIGEAILRCTTSGRYQPEPPVCRDESSRTGDLSGPDDNVYKRPELNFIPDTVNIRRNPKPGVDEPDNRLDSGILSANLNLGGIVALGVFGGFVFLAAVITTIVIMVRRSRRRGPCSGGHHHCSEETGPQSLASTDTDSSRALTRFYHHPRAPHHHHHHRRHLTKDPTRHQHRRRPWSSALSRSHATGPESDLVANEMDEVSAPAPSEGQRPHHHHHHRQQRHHHHHHHHHHARRHDPERKLHRSHMPVLNKQHH